MRQDTTVGNRGADQGVELFVTTNGELKMSGRDALDLEVLGGVLQQVVSEESDGVCGARTRSTEMEMKYVRQPARELQR